jgi:Ribbon-helix-helix protein, copG family
MIDTQVAPEPRIFHTLLTFRCPTTLSEQFEAEAARRGTNSASRVIRELLQQALKASAT